MTKTGRPKKPNKKIKTCIAIDPDLYKATTGMNRSEIINKALKEYLNKPIPKMLSTS